LAERYAIISDIHGNFEALTAVFEDIGARGIAETICLGDIVGYGPNPEECLDLVAMRCRLILMGNHDYALVNQPLGFSRIAAQSIECTREIMLTRCMNVRVSEMRFAFLRDLPERVVEGRVLYVHASPRDPLTEYLLVSDSSFGPSQKVVESMRLVDHLCFIGHTHIPCIITEDFKVLRPTDDAHRFPITRQKMIINDGSVGQPRDRDVRACYCEVTPEEIIYHRVPYDYGVTQRKIAAIGCLHSRCADRLAEGR